MEILLTKETQARMDQLSSDTGRSPEEFVQDAIAGYFDELSQVRTRLDTRYDDVVHGRVKLIQGEEVVARLRERSMTRRRQTA